MESIRSKLAAGDIKTTKHARKLEIYSGWTDFELAISKDNRPEKTWAAAVVHESSAYMHKLGLMGDRRKELLHLIQSGAPVTRVSHQPNLFASLNILGLNHLAGDIADATKSVAVFVSIDYDEAGDQRFRSTILPPTSGSTPQYLSRAVPKDQRRAIACSIEKPSIQSLRYLLDTQKHSVKYWRRQLGLPPVRQSLLDTSLFEPYLANASSLAEFNLALIAHFTKEVFNKDIVVVQASKLLPHLNEQVNKLAGKLIAFEPTCANKLVWHICNKCYQRLPTKLKSEDGSILVEWNCTRCRLAATGPLDWTATINSAVEPVPAFVPRITLCDAIDFQLARSCGSISYAGGIRHILNSRILAQKAALKLGPEFIWDPDCLQFVNDNEKSGKNWAMGKFSAFMLADLFGSERLRREIDRNISTQGSDKPL